ncbi:MAG: thiol peroxidase [Candidatus Oxydemutatoraceae bacterium WSBS_2016_MAG_OTU14]
MSTITLHGNQIKTNGKIPELFSIAPDFTLVNKDLEDVSLKKFEDKIKLISVVPSLDTPVCASSTKKFNRWLEKYPQLAILIVSADLPFAMTRFCSGDNNLEVVPLSMMRSNEFAQKYGVLIETGPLAGITARAVFLLDKSNKIVYSQLVGEISDEPDYSALEEKIIEQT